MAQKHISAIIGRRIAAIILATMGVLLVIAGVGLYYAVGNSATRLLRRDLNDVKTQYESEEEGYLLSSAAQIYRMYQSEGAEVVTSPTLAALAISNYYDELNLIDRNGVIVASSNNERIGFDLHTNARAAQFLALLDTDLALTQDYGRPTDGAGYNLRYAGMRLPDGTGLIQVGMSVDSHKVLAYDVLRDIAESYHVGESGFILVCNDRNVIASSKTGYVGMTPAPSQRLDEYTRLEKAARERLFGIDSYVLGQKIGGYKVLGVYPVREPMRTYRIAIASVSAAIVLMAFILLALLNLMMRSYVVDKVVEVDKSLAAITAGDLDQRVEVGGSQEFEELSEGINATVDKLKELIKQEATRLDAELSTAKTIQQTSLPSVFPPFPSRTDFGLHATMEAARQVGGDFYDFYLLSDTKLAVVIADVSDKGIPAAMFMMRAMTSIKSHAVSGIPVDEVITQTNRDLCEENDLGMFVTVWMGICDLETGLMEYVHAGHTCPMLLRGGEVTRIRKKRNMMVGAMPEARYRRQELQLEPGDTLFLYTDGVTEAFDVNNDLYGNEHLEATLTEVAATASTDDPNERCQEICRAVRDDVAAFSAGAPQSDDITMLAFTYLASWQS